MILGSKPIFTIVFARVFLGEKIHRLDFFAVNPFVMIFTNSQSTDSNTISNIEYIFCPQGPLRVTSAPVRLSESRAKKRQEGEQDDEEEEGIGFREGRKS